MKKTVFLILALILLGSFMSSSLLVQGAEKACNGQVTIIACPNSNGCLIFDGSVAPRYFVTNSEGWAVVSNLCEGYYYVCVENCGNGKFYSDGGSDIVYHVTNGADCNCP